MAKPIKLTGSILIYRKILPHLKCLSTTEFSLFIVLLLIVDWDKSHAKYSTTDISNSQLKEWYLSKLSLATISRAKKKLKEEGFINIQKDPHDKRLEITKIPNFWKYQSKEGIKQMKETLSKSKGNVSNEHSSISNRSGLGQNENTGYPRKFGSGFTKIEEIINEMKG